MFKRIVDRKRLGQLGPLLLAAMLAAGLSAFAQRKAEPPPPPPRPRAQSNKPPNGQQGGLLNVPPRWIAPLQQMSPAEQEKFLANNERFRNLPPQRQAQIRQQLQRWNNLSPGQRQTMLDRQQIWNRLTPEQQGYVLNSLWPRYQNTPPARRQAILGKLRDLRGLDDSQRAAKLNDESFLSGLNPDDRQMLRDLSNLRVAEPELPPSEP